MRNLRLTWQAEERLRALPTLTEQRAMLEALGRLTGAGLAERGSALHVSALPGGWRAIWQTEAGTAVILSLSEGGRSASRLASRERQRR